MSKRITAPSAVAVSVAVAVGFVVLVTIGLSLAGQRAFHGSDILESFAPWRSVPPDGVVPANTLIGDTVDAVMPAKAVFGDRLASGDVALWQSLQLGGRPLAALPNAALLSPLNLPYWIAPLWYAPGIVKLLEILVAIGFTGLFLRSVGLARSSAAVGGLIFAFSGFQVAWNNWSQTHVGALIAGLFWAIDFAIKRYRAVAFLPLAGVVAIMWLEGFPSVTGYALLFGGAYALVRVFSVRGWPRRVIALGGLAVGVVIGTAIAALQLVPFFYSLQNLDLSARTQSSAIHMPMRVIATFVVPNAFGSPVDRNYYGPINYIEIQSFIGIVAVVLIALAIGYGRKSVSAPVFWYFIVAATTALVLMFIGGPALALLQKTPLFGINFIGRLRSVLGFLLAVLAAIGFEALVRSVPAARRYRDGFRFLAALVLISGAIVFGLYRSWQMAAAHLETGYLSRHLIIAGVVFALALAAVAIAHVRVERFISIGRIALPLLIAAEIVLFAVPFWPQIPVEQFYPRTESHVFLSERLGSDRLVSAGLAMYPGTTSFYGLRSVSGHAFHDPAWRDLLEAVDSNVMHASPTFSILASDATVGMSPVLDRIGARYFVVDPRVRLAGVITDMETHERVTMDGGFETEIRSAGVLRGIALEIPDGFDPGPNPDQLTVELVDSSGAVLSDGFRRIDKWLRPGFIEVAVPEALSRGDTVIRLRYEGDTPMLVAAGVDGEPSIGLITAEDDGLRLVYAGGTVIYERLSALSRIRWAGRAVVVEDPGERIGMLSDGVAADTVVLSEPGSRGSGADARVEILSDSGDQLTVLVHADGDGYLVVADSMQRDWAATVDGSPRPIVAADHAVAAIGVAAGRHTVKLAYTPEGWRMGMAISAGALAISLAVAVGAFVRRKPDADPTNDSEV